MMSPGPQARQRHPCRRRPAPGEGSAAPRTPGCGTPRHVFAQNQVWLTSEDATQDRPDVRSYIDTARKHGHRPLDVLRRLFTGNPWQPSAPAPA